MDTNDNDFPLHLHEVGKPYHPYVQSWPETSQYNYRGGEHDLVLFLDSPTEREVQAARTGKAEFALLAQDGVIMLCHRFLDGLPWSDSAFSIWLVPSAERVLPPVLQGAERALMFFSLVDARTGILLTLRSVSLSSEFTTHLHEAIRRQAGMSFKGKADNDKRIARIRRRYRTTDALVADATARCTGGTDDTEQGIAADDLPDLARDRIVTERTTRAIYVNYPTLDPPPAEFTVEDFYEWEEDHKILLVNGDDSPDDGPINVDECLAAGAIKAVTVKVGGTDQRLYMVQPGFYHHALGFRHPGRGE